MSFIELKNKYNTEVILCTIGASIVDIKTTCSVSVTERQVEEDMPDVIVENSSKKRKLPFRRK